MAGNFLYPQKKKYFNGYDQNGWSSGNALDIYSVCAEYEHQPGHQLILTKGFVFSSARPSKF
jgi:hypothetical protein